MANVQDPFVVGVAHAGANTREGRESIKISVADFAHSLGNLAGAVVLLRNTEAQKQARDFAGTATLSPPSA